MTTEYLTNANGIQFYIEPAYRAINRAIPTGFFAGLVVDNDELRGVWFETKEAALDAVAEYRG